MKYTFGQIAINSTAKKKPTEEDKLNYIGLEHLSSDTFDVPIYGSDVAPTGEKLIIKKGDILFGKRRAYQKKVGISPIDGIFSAHGFVLRPREEVVCPEYFPFFIASNQFLETAIRISVGGLSPTVNWKDIEKQEFDLPPLSEQKVLAEKLWAAYRLKESYKRMIEATDEMVKSQFIEMFGKTELIPLSFYADSLLGGVSLAGGTENSHKVITTGAVTTDYFKETQYKFLPNDYIPNKEHLINRGDVIVCRKNSLEFVGNAAFVGSISTELYLSDLTWKIVFNGNAIPHFVWQALIMPNTKQQIRNMASGTCGSMRNITKPNLLKVLLPKATIQEQLKFVTITEQADKSKFELREQSNE